MPEQNHRAQVVATRHQDFVIATGSIGAKDDVTLAFEEGGVVREVRHVAGDSVEEGAVIASLNAAAIEADVQAQRSRLEQEIVRLNSFVGGPEEFERARVKASIAVSEQSLKNELRIALALARQTAGAIENMARTQVDPLFDGTPEDSHFLGKVPVADRQGINRTREEFERAFSRWRAWSDHDGAGYKQVTETLLSFEQDLRSTHTGVIQMYDALLKVQTLGREKDSAFLAVASLRETVLKAITETTERLNKIMAERAKYRLALAQSGETLAGGTQAERLVQSAQVDAEKERLRRLEAQLAKTRIRAPFNGVVGEVLIRAGEFVPSGAEAVRLVSRGGFDLSVNVTEVDIQAISPGTELRAEVEVTGEDLTVRARTVDATEKRIDSVPVYTVVFDVLEDPSVALRSGMTVDVRVPSGVPVDAFIVPLAAIIRNGPETAVLVERGDTRMLVPVTVGSPVDDGMVTVTGELTEGDVVVFGGRGAK